MKLTFLGTGTSVGIPVIGCDCAVCRSSEPRNRRRRTSLLVEAGGQSVVVDTPPDFREQALDHRIRRVDAVLFSHAHADHVFGFDDIRRFNTMQDAVIPAYANRETVDDLRRIFNYVERKRVAGLYHPRITFVAVEEPFAIGDLRVTPLPVEHATTPTLGYRFDADGHSAAYVPDCRRMPESTLDQLGGLDVMILDALRRQPHATHLSVDESVALLIRIGAQKSYMTHMCHDLEHWDLEKALPEGIHVAYDGLILSW